MDILGLDARAYYNHSGDWGNPDFREITSAREVNLNLETGQADLSVRTNVWRKSKAALLDATISITMLADRSVPVTRFRTAYFTRSGIEVLILDGSISVPGSEGLRAFCTVTGFSRGEPLEEGVTYDVELKPAVHTHNPTWHTT